MVAAILLKPQNRRLRAKHTEKGGLSPAQQTHTERV